MNNVVDLRSSKVGPDVEPESNLIDLRSVSLSRVSEKVRESLIRIQGQMVLMPNAPKEYA